MSRPLEAHIAYRALKGIFAVYKPSAMTAARCSAIIKLKLCDDLNALPQRRVDCCPHTGIGLMNKGDSYSELINSELVLGPRYEFKDFKIRVHDMHKNAAGVTLVGIGKTAVNNLFTLNLKESMKVYHVTGTLGKSSDDFSSFGRINGRHSYGHVNKWKIERLCSIMEANHQKELYRAAGINLQSVEAYEIAKKGLIRTPFNKKASPVLYNVKCIDFQPPHFTLEIHSMNEYYDYIKNIIHEMGMGLKSLALCDKVRRVQLGKYTLEQSIVSDQWDLVGILNGLKACQDTTNAYLKAKEEEIDTFVDKLASTLDSDVV